uniref:NADH dehydrogenase subunit 6 n=1 Tax=Diplorchis hangzhouensis TaxID=1131906 RepID=A0A3G0WP15_9PLAT|nr:NADH dehydrogenase subunit 6 [Diplorchis hangzhouensis]
MFCVFFSPIVCCLLLLFNSLLLSVILYLFVGNSIFSLFFSLIYVGGVYIIMLFVSAHLQNDNFNNGLSLYFGVVFLGGFCLLGFEIWCWDFIFDNMGEMLCSYISFDSYILYGVSIFLIFFVLSNISSSNNGFLR